MQDLNLQVQTIPEIDELPCWLIRSTCALPLGVSTLNNRSTYHFMGRLHLLYTLKASIWATRPIQVDCRYAGQRLWLVRPCCGLTSPKPIRRMPLGLGRTIHPPHELWELCRLSQNLKKHIGKYLPGSSSLERQEFGIKPRSTSAPGVGVSLFYCTKC